MSIDHLAERERFSEAVAAANVPTLLMVLVQLTGDMRWLEAPYLPVKARGLSDNETGGLPDDVQEMIRGEALAAILAWRSGKPVAIAQPTSELLIAMMSVAMGEAVPDAYAPMIKSVCCWTTRARRFQSPDNRRWNLGHLCCGSTSTGGHCLHDPRTQ
jgi:hypothetical protein